MTSFGSTAWAFSPAADDAGSAPVRPAVFTIVSANYIAFAATLMQSVRRFHPDVPRFIVLADALHAFDLDIAADLLACDALGIQLLDNMKLWYSVIELNTAVKPFVFQHLFTELGFDAAIYLDPDIQLHGPLDEVFGGLVHHSLVLTPHMTKPLQDGKHPSDLSIMKAGIYNLGFAAIRNDEDGRSLVRWWCDRLFAHCRVDVPGNLFTDQRWMDLAPAFVERTLLLRHPGYNAAYWNLVHRDIVRDQDGQWRCNGLPLVFFHFSGIKPEDPTVFSKHQNRFTVETLGEVAQLCTEYRGQVLANGWLTHNRIPYAYANFSDGRPILEPMRRWILRAIDDGRLPMDRALRLGSTFFDEADENTAAAGELTRFAYQFWLDRADLQAAFDIAKPDGHAAYVGWLCDGAAEREDVPRPLIQAACALRDGHAAEREWPATPSTPPWDAISVQSWYGPANQVDDWLRGEIGFQVGAAQSRAFLDRQVALLWERRIDLQQFFTLQTMEDVEAFQVWALTTGMKEGSILPELMSDEFRAWLDAPSSIARLYDEVPITKGMALTRHCSHARNGLQSWRDFPMTPKSRIEQAFWYAYIAPRLFGWPPAMTASVRAELGSPSAMTIGSFALSRAMVALADIREDVRQTFDLEDEDERWRYLSWLMIQGVREYDIDPVDLCPGIAEFFSSASGRYRGLNRLLQFVYEQREDLRLAFDLGNPADVTGLLNWAHGEITPWLAAYGLASLRQPGPAVALVPPPVRVLATLSGDWDAPSGVGEDLRSSVAALVACGFADYLVVNLTAGTILRPDGTALPPGTPVEAEWNIVHHNADTAVPDWLTMRKLDIHAQHTVGHWHWELERLPSYWRHAFSFYDEIWASSSFAADAFSADGRRPVHLLNGAVTAPKLDRPPSRSRLGLEQDATVFLFMFDFGSYASRKNPYAVIDAFALAFPGGDEPVQLLIKTQNAEARPYLWAELTGRTQDERIVFRNERLSRNDAVGLIATADAFVSLHRSEGYGRAPAEAMLLGLPVILTGYSGTTDFTDADCACVVDYTLIPVDPAEYPGVERQRWADADVYDAARYMRWVADEPDAARAMGQRGRQRILDELSPAKVGAAMVAMMRGPVSV